MNRQQLEKLYLVNGIYDYKLRNLEDLINVHGIDAAIVKGYSDLNINDRNAFETFIVKYLNSHGLDHRLIINFTKVYRAYEVDYLIRQEEGDFVFAGEVWNCTNKNTKVRSWGEIKNKNNPETIKSKTDDYLRVEFKEGKYKIWLHIINEGEGWY